MRPRRGASWLPSLVFGALLLALWWFFTTFGFVDAYFLPSPQETTARVDLRLALRLFSRCVGGNPSGSHCGLCCRSHGWHSSWILHWEISDLLSDGSALLCRLAGDPRCGHRTAAYDLDRLWPGFDHRDVTSNFPAASPAVLHDTGTHFFPTFLVSPYSHDGDPACRAVNPGGATYGIHTRLLAPSSAK